MLLPLLYQQSPWLITVLELKVRIQAYKHENIGFLYRSIRDRSEQEQGKGRV